MSQGAVNVDGLEGAATAEILGRTRGIDEFLVLNSARKPVINSDAGLEGVAKGSDHGKDSDGAKRQGNHHEALELFLKSVGFLSLSFCTLFCSILQFCRDLGIFAYM